MKVPTVGISHPTIIVRNLMHLLMTKSTAPAKMMRAATGRSNEHSQHGNIYESCS